MYQNYDELHYSIIEVTIGTRLKAQWASYGPWAMVDPPLL